MVGSRYAPRHALPRQAPSFALSRSGTTLGLSRFTLSLSGYTLTLSALLWCTISLTAMAGAPYCDNAYFWFSDPQKGVQRGSANWGSTSRNSRFKVGPCFEISGIGITETQYKKVIVIDRTDTVNGYMRWDDGGAIFAEEVDIVTGAQRPLDVITNTFCSSGQFMADGTFLSIGGSARRSTGYRELPESSTKPNSGELNYTGASRLITTAGAQREVRGLSEGGEGQGQGRRLVETTGSSERGPGHRQEKDFGGAKGLHEVGQEAEYRRRLGGAEGSYEGGQEAVHRRRLNTPVLQNGAFSVRAFFPCWDGDCDFEMDGQMTSARWYPSTQLLPDGRLFIVGGSFGGTDLNNQKSNNPTVEYYPRGKREGRYDLPFLKRSMPFNLYPFVHLLPSGRIFIFASDSYTLWDTRTNKEVSGRRLKIDNGDDVVRSYPLPGTSALFPLTSSNGYKAEIMVCGGSKRRAKQQNGKPGDQWEGADKNCYRIIPESTSPRWEKDSMRYRRVMPNAVLLPDGNVLIINGMQTGVASIPNLAHLPALRPEMYHSTKRRWYPGKMVESKIPRGYHASALLLHDGTVLVSGGNPNNGIKEGPKDFPTEFRTEYFYPPYLLSGALPRVTAAPQSVKIKTGFLVKFKAKVGITRKRVSVVLCQPGFSTHSSNHGMRNVVLDITSFKGNGDYQILVNSPPNTNICPPTWYWLFVLVDGRPNREGRAIFIKA